MKSKFNLKGLANVKWIGVATAVVTAVAAFTSEMQSQKKEKAFDDLVERVSKLENK